MPDWVTTPIEFILGPLIMLIVLPVIPTIWIFFVYPIFAYRLKHSKINFSYWTRIGMFYFFTAIFCIPILPTIKETIEYPRSFYPLIHSWGFWSLIGYSAIVTILHKSIEKVAGQSLLIQKMKNRFIEVGLRLLIKIKIAKKEQKQN